MYEKCYINKVALPKEVWGDTESSAALGHTLLYCECSCRGNNLNYNIQFYTNDVNLACIIAGQLKRNSYPYSHWA